MTTGERTISWAPLRRTAQATLRINRAAMTVSVGFCVGVVGVVLARNPLVAVVPAMAVWIDAILVAAARKAQHETLRG